MRLNHLDLPVPDVAEARAFFERWFGFRHERTLGQDGLSVMSDESGLVLVLSRRQRRGAQEFPGGFHIGFHQPTAEAVQNLYQQLAEAGLAAEPPKEQHGAFCFYLLAPGGVLVEIAHRPG
jgi:catechol 2,3-dioxygenase-like lactoylglutathione lyase family enzyme